MAYGQTITKNEGTYAELSDIENARAVDRIETAERDAPFCLCGANMIAVAHDDAVWLECSRRQQQRHGPSGLFDRIDGFLAHSHRHVMELPTND